MFEKDNLNNNNIENSDIVLNEDSNVTQTLNQNVNQEFSYEWRNDLTSDNEIKRTRSSSKKLKVLLAISLTFLLISVMFIFVLITSRNDPLFVESENPVAATSSEEGTSEDVSYSETIKVQAPSNGEMTLTELYEKVSNGCCSILCEYTSGSGWTQTSGTSLGSGFVITEDGYIVTNHHVIENANKIEVVFYDDTKYEATLVGSDSICDIAVLKIEGSFQPVELGDSNLCKVGNFVCAIGTPSDIQFAGTLTFGCISAINRDVSITNSSGIVIKTMTLIQTEATLNPGNSGGPLFNMYGQVVGINTLKLTSQYEGIGFSIPISGAKDIINQIIEFGYVKDNNGTVSQGAPYLGITPSDISEEDAAHYNVPVGVLVYQIESTNSSYKAGLRRGDIIVEFAGEKVTSSNTLKTILGSKKAGETVKIKVYRDSTAGGEYIEFDFKLDARS